MNPETRTTGVRLLMLSVDTSIFKEGSGIRSRVEHYGSLVDDIIILSLGAPTDAREFLIGTTVKVIPVPGRFKIDAVWKAIGIARSVMTPETVVVTQDPFEVGVIGAVISILTRQPLNVQVHIDFFSPYFRQESLRQRFQAILAPFVLFRAKSIRVVSEKIAEYLRKDLEIDAKKITIAPIFVDATEVRNKPITIDLHKELPQFEWIALVACRLVAQKNVGLAIEAFNIFKQLHEKVGMVIVGSGYEEKALREKVEDLDLTDTVKFGNWTKEFASCMRTSDVFVMSSDYEGWGMTVVEAAALAKPIVMTNVGCANEFLINEKNGLVVPVRDQSALAEAFEKLYTNRQYARTLAQVAEHDALVYMTHDENDILLKRSWEISLSSHK